MRCDVYNPPGYDPRKAETVIKGRIGNGVGVCIYVRPIEWIVELFPDGTTGPFRQSNAVLDAWDREIQRGS